MIEIKDKKLIKKYGLKIMFWDIDNVLYVLKFRDINSNKLFYAMLSEDEDGRVGSIIVVETLGKGRKSVIDKLCLDLSNQELLGLEKFISKTNTIRERIFYSKFGFYENYRGDVCFNGSDVVVMGGERTQRNQIDYTYDEVDPPEFIRRLDNIVENDEGEVLFETGNHLLKKGSLEDSIDFYRNEVTSKGMRLAVATGFASPIIHLLGMKPILLNLYGETSKGKTITTTLISSLFSSPDDARLMVDFDRTLLSLEKHLEDFKGLPLVIDDASTYKDNKQVGSEFIYALAKGKGRSRIDVRNDFTATMPGEWSNSIIMSSEVSILEYCNPNKLGVLRRIIEFEVEDKSLTIDANHADKIENFIYKNYGQLGNAFIKEIAKSYSNGDVLIQLYDNENEVLNNLATDVFIDRNEEGSNSRLSGYIKMVTPILMAVHILRENMLIDFKIDEIRLILLDLFEKGSSRLGRNLKSKSVERGV